MQIKYDAKYDLLRILLGTADHEVETIRVDDDIALDLDEQGRLHSIEILEASKRVDLAALLPVAAEA